MRETCCKSAVVFIFIHYSLTHVIYNFHLKFVLMNAIKLNFKLCVRKRENLNFVTVTEDELLLVVCDAVAVHEYSNSHEISHDFI